MELHHQSLQSEIHAFNQQIILLNELVCEGLLATEPDKRLIEELFSLQFAYYKEVRFNLSVLVGDSHPLISKFETLIFERRLAITLIQLNISI